MKKITLALSPTFFLQFKTTVTIIIKGENEEEVETVKNIIRKAFKYKNYFVREIGVGNDKQGSLE